MIYMSIKSKKSAAAVERMFEKMKFNVRKYLKTAIKMFILIICSVAAATALLTSVYCIPTDNIRKHASESLETFNNEGLYPVLSKYCSSQLDNFTDAVMFNEAVYDGDENVLKKSLLSNMRKGKISKNSDPISSLNMVLSGQQDQLNTVSYGRYWHGYLIFLKPLLVFFNYKTIRIINLIMQSIINILICCALFKKNIRYTAAYILSACMIMPLTTAFSLQFSDIFYIFAIASLVILYKNDALIKKDRYLLFFTGIGIATAFFDFLTYPIAAFGIPAVIYMVVNDTEPLKTRVINMVKFFVCWGIGYALMWSGKWIMATLFTDENIIVNALRAVDTRVGMNEYDIPRVIYRNIRQFVKTPVTLVLMVFIGMEIAVIVKKRGCAKENILKCIPYIMICILPVLWYVFACNHSAVHYWFTNKALIASAFAGMCMIIEMRISENRENTHKNKLL